MRYLYLLYVYYKIKKSNLFDKDWYLNSYPDVKESGVNPLRHYVLYGYKEGRNPNKKFNTIFYLKNYSDVKESGLNPFYHYIKFGIKEKRNTNTNTNTNTYIKNSFLLRDTQFHNVQKREQNATIAIIAELSIPQCLKYRVKQTRDILSSNGFNVEISGWRDIERALNLLQRASIVIFYRVPLHNSYYEKYFAECKRLNISIGYDIDDPMFDLESVINNNNADYIDSNIANNIVNDVPSYLLALSSSDFCIVSTEGLKNIVLKNGYKNKIIVRTNGIDSETKTLSNLIENNSNTNIINLIYATPSKAHQADFSMIEDVIIQLLNNYKGKVRLTIIGYFKFTNEKYKNISKYIDHEKVGSYSDFLKILAKADINLVPLIKTIFNESKSNIKFLDAASVNIASVCSNIGDYKNLHDGHDCYLADNTQQWFEKISKLVDDEQVRRSIILNSKNTLQAKYDLDIVGRELIDYLKEITNEE